MEYLLELLGNYFQDDGQRKGVFLILTATSIFLLGLAGSSVIIGLTDPVRRRLAHMVGIWPRYWKISAG